MENKDLRPDDWGRIFLGEVPPEFLLEAMIRMTCIYIVLVVALRVMGRRMEAMLSRGEMVSLVTLGASVGVAIHTPERGLLPSALVILIILGMQLLQALLTSRNSRMEKALLDEITTVVVAGRLQLPEMKKSRITRERLFAALRFKGIKNLGTVERVYFEAKGVFSIVAFADRKDRRGLCILPDSDQKFRQELAFDAHCFACRACGNLDASIDSQTLQCTRCGKSEWEEALVGSE